MTRHERVSKQYAKAREEGYEFLCKGMGSYDKAYEEYKAEGYDVRCWYTSITKEGRQWIMVGKKSVRSAKLHESIRKAIEDGFELMSHSTGYYDAEYEQYKSMGYDVRCWYTSLSKDAREYVLYAKKLDKKSDSSLVPMPGIERLEELKTPDYASMTVKELRKICSEKKISGYSKMNKDQIVHVLAAC